jgi:hypothetical protein
MAAMAPCPELAVVFIIIVAVFHGLLIAGVVDLTEVSPNKINSPSPSLDLLAPPCIWVFLRSLADLLRTELLVTPQVFNYRH